jgi:hypothetical protein
MKKQISHEISYECTSDFNLIQTEDGDILIEVQRHHEDGIFDDEHFDVEVEITPEGDYKFNPHDFWKTPLYESEVAGMKELVAEYLKSKG